MNNLPRTAEEYRQWWAENTDVPWGFCWCGCNQPTKLAPRTQRSRQWFEGAPQKFLHRHPTTRKSVVDFAVNKNGGLCYCGCGTPTPLAKQTSRGQGTIKGRPIRYINGHHLRDFSYKVEDHGYVTPCWVWHNATSRGYGVLRSGGTTVYAHRYFYEQEYGPIPPAHHVHHKCEVQQCVRVEHLECLPNRTHSRLHSISGMTMENARKVRHLVIAANLSQGKVAEHFGVSKSVVQQIVSGRTWNED